MQYSSRFYQFEADERISISSDFQMLQENLEMIRKAIESKKPNERIKVEIEVFNQKINEYNYIVKKINETNEDLNKFRSKYLDEWNSATNDVMSKHID